MSRRLANVGLDVFFSDDDMHTGDDPNVRVKQAIHDASVAIFALSDESVGRPWVHDEIAWCELKRSEPNANMKKLMPVIVGPLSQEKVPRIIKDLHLFDLTDERRWNERLQRLINDVSTALGKDQPIILPAAIFAMTQEQFDTLLSQPPQALGHLVALCMAVGMSQQTDVEALKEQLSGRYGASADDFRPFRGQPPLSDIINDSIRALNRKLKKLNQQTVFVRWDHKRLLDPTNDFEDWFVESRRNSSCLTIIDSVSAFHSDIQSAITRTPSPRTERRYGLAWIPPYFESPRKLEQETKEATSRVGVQPLSAAFLDWQALTDRWVAFDTGSATSLKQWILRAVGDLAQPPDPIGGLTDSMGRAFPSPRIEASGFYSSSKD